MTPSCESCLGMLIEELAVTVSSTSEDNVLQLPDCTYGKAFSEVQPKISLPKDSTSQLCDNMVDHKPTSDDSMTPSQGAKNDHSKEKPSVIVCLAQMKVSHSITEMVNLFSRTQSHL